MADEDGAVFQLLLYIIYYRLFLRRADLDNMQKSRLRRIYPPSFSIEMLFEQWTNLEEELVD